MNDQMRKQKYCFSIGDIVYHIWDSKVEIVEFRKKSVLVKILNITKEPKMLVGIESLKSLQTDLVFEDEY